MRHRLIAVFAALVACSVAPAAFALTFTLDGGGLPSGDALAGRAPGFASDTSVLPSLPGVGSVTDGILSTVGYDYALEDAGGALVHSPVSSPSMISFSPVTHLELMAVPEPSTGLLLASGLALLAAARRRRSR